MGRIGRPHGLHGEVTVLPETDDPERFAPGATFVTDRDRELSIRTVQPYRDRGLVVAFHGVRGREEAEALRGSVLTIDATERRPLGAGEFWPDDLVGLEAVDPEGTSLGTIDRIEFGPGQDRLVVVTAAGGEVLVPFVSEFVGDPEEERIVIDPPVGLFEQG